MTTLQQAARRFGPITYPVPRIGEHGSLNCLFGIHWWAAVRRQADGVVVAVACGACRKLSPVQGLDADQRGAA